MKLYNYYGIYVNGKIKIFHWSSSKLPKLSEVFWWGSEKRSYKAAKKEIESRYPLFNE